MDTPIVPLFMVAVPALILGGMNLYQAVTGKRLSKRPSVRTDAVMRRQSAIAATVLLVLCALLILEGIALSL